MPLAIKRIGVEREEGATVKITLFSIAVGNVRFYILMF